MFESGPLRYLLTCMDDFVDDALWRDVAESAELLSASGPRLPRWQAS